MEIFSMMEAFFLVSMLKLSLSGMASLEKGLVGVLVL